VAQTYYERTALMTRPRFANVARGHFERPCSGAFLTTAYHHVRPTAPLLRACGARLGDGHRFVLTAVKDYVVEEFGHEHWILNDLEACGVTRRTVEESVPGLDVELLVAYVRDYISHRHPLGLLGMVHVLEGTSTALATTTADMVQRRLGLPDAAFSYLRSHGDLDIEHVAFFRDVVDRLGAEDVGHVVYVARRVYRLYAAMLATIAHDYSERRNAA
jgi:pyrroloquinoline quinone (PQQ) biosynthesis protein C